MLDDKVRDEMRFYAETDDYSDPERYERFALNCKLEEKASEIGKIIRCIANWLSGTRGPCNILETASATGLTALGVTLELTLAGIAHTYTSLDLEQNLLCFAKQLGRGDQFVRGDFENLPFASDKFDIYIMMGAEGCRTTGRFYPEVYRTLRLGGCYVMPQTGPRSFVCESEKENAFKSGLDIIRADTYLIARKS